MDTTSLVNQLTTYFGWTADEAADFIERSSRTELAFIMAAIKTKTTKGSDTVNQDLYCMAQHLQSFLDDAYHLRVADFGFPCATCKFLKDCDLDFYKKAKTLTELTGIEFNPFRKGETGKDRTLKLLQAHLNK